MEVFGWVLAGFTGIVTVLIGWQIYMVVWLKREMRAALKKMLEKAKGEAIGTAMYNIAQHAQRNGDYAYALSSYIKAAHNLKEIDTHKEEIELCLDFIENILGKINHEKLVIVLPKETIIEYYNMLYRVNQRSKGLAALYLHQVKEEM
jgi:hypothetical protein